MVSTMVSKWRISSIHSFRAYARKPHLMRPQHNPYLSGVIHLSGTSPSLLWGALRVPSLANGFLPWVLDVTKRRLSVDSRPLPRGGHVAGASRACGGAADALRAPRGAAAVGEAPRLRGGGVAGEEWGGVVGVKSWLGTRSIDSWFGRTPKTEKGLVPCDTLGVCSLRDPGTSSDSSGWLPVGLH